MTIGTPASPSGIEKRRILIVLNTRVHVAETRKIVQELGNVYDFSFVDQDSNLVELLTESVTVKRTRLSGAFLEALRFLGGYILRAIKYVAPEFLRTTLHVFALIAHYFSFSARFKAALRRTQPNILLLHEGNASYLSEMCIKVARRHNIPSVILPYTICNPTEPAEFILSSEKCSLYIKFPFQTLFKKRFPHWIYSYKGHDILRLPLTVVLLQEILGVAAPLPWVQESSTANALLTESEKNRLHYLAYGISDKQIHVIGNANHDIFYELLSNKEKNRSKLNAMHGFSDDLPVIAVSVQPSFFDLRTEQADYQSINDLLLHWCQHVQSIKGYNIILAPHPSLNLDLDYLENSRIRIAKVNTAYLLPLADLYIASISATIKWAIACGIPVINYDYYRFRYDDYKNVGGVFNCYDKAVFEAEIEQIAINPEQYILEKSALIRPHSGEWGRVDGKFRQRFMAIVETLLNEAAASK